MDDCMSITRSIHDGNGWPIFETITLSALFFLCLLHLQHPSPLENPRQSTEKEGLIYPKREFLSATKLEQKPLAAALMQVGLLGHHPPHITNSWAQSNLLRLALFEANLTSLQ